MSRPSLSELTADLESAAERGATGSEIADALRSDAPDLTSQIEADRDQPQVLGAWGLSATRDASQPDVPTTHPAILDAIGQLADVDLTGDAVHAGLMHTYGYLLSNLETPFGFKRERYTSGSIATGLALEPRDLLSPWPSRGTLLSNLSAIAGDIAASNSDFARDRFVEHSPAHDLTLQTDLVAFPNADEIKGTHLLVYSLQHGAAPQQLITAFPVEPWAHGKLLKRAKKAAGRSDLPIRLRYNARLPDIDPEQLVGTLEFHEGV